MIYFDNAATTPMPVLLAMKFSKYIMDYYGNPSSIYEIGVKSREAIENARARIAKCINASPDEIYFTSGGTEADNWAINGAIICDSAHVITSSFEHKAVLKTVKHNVKDNTIINPNKNGFVELKDLMNAKKDNTMLISIMMVNNEIGTIQHIKEFAQWARHNEILFHTDAVQAVGHIPIDVKDLSIDFLSASAHKFHGPKGVGFLYVRNDIKDEFYPMLFGGLQEDGMRAGTENTASIISMADALEWTIANGNYGIQKIQEYLIESLRSINGVHINGSLNDRICSNINIYIENVDAEMLMMMLNQNQICVSAGAACNSGDKNPSHVLKAIGCSDERAANSIRISLSCMNTMAEAKEFIKYITYYIKTIREE